MTRWVLGIFAITAILAVGLLLVNMRPRDTSAAQVTLQLKWFDQTQFAGFYVAKLTGEYEKRGLNVDIVPGGYNVNAVEQLASGQAQFAIIDGGQALIANEKRGGLKVIGAVFNRSPVCLMYKNALGIRNPVDLVGKKVGVYRGLDTESVLLSILAKRSIDPTTVNIEQASTLDAFKQGLLDVHPSYVFNEPLIMKRGGVPVSCIRPDDYGVLFYGDVLAVNEKFYRDNPDLVKAFYSASAAGWEVARSDQKLALKLTLEAAKNLSGKDLDTVTHQREMLAAVMPLLGDGGNSAIFYMNKNRWAEMAGWLQNIGRLSKPDIVDSTVVYELNE